MNSFYKSIVIKMLVYGFLATLLTQASFYIFVNPILLLSGLLIGAIVDISFSYISFRKLNKIANKYVSGDGSNVNGNLGYEEEIIRLAIKKKSDDYYLRLKNIEEKYEDSLEYQQLWTHEAKIGISNVKTMISKYDNLDLECELENLQSMVEFSMVASSIEEINSNKNVKPENLKQIINRVIKSEMNNFIANGVTVSVIGEEVIQVNTDSYWLSFIIKQYVNNSLKYGAKNISIKYDNSCIVVSDDGPGIPEVELSLVFNKFYCSVTTKESIKSSGYGLYIANSIANNFGYTLKLVNNQNGLDAKVIFI